MFSYRQILKQALRISWKNKYLWFFGIFASLLTIGAEYQVLARSLSQKATLEWFYNWQAFLDSGVLRWRFFADVFGMFQKDPVSMAILLVILLVVVGLGVFLIWLAVSSQAALVNNADKILKSKKDELDVSVREGLVVGHKNFWPVFGLNVLSKIVINVIVLLITIPLLFTFSNKLVVNVIYVLFFIVLMPIAISMALLIKYAIAFVVLKKERFGMALKKGWDLFNKNWIISIEMAFLLFLVSFLATLAILVGLMILSLPFILFATSFLQLFSVAAFWAVVLLGVIVLVAFIILAGSFLSTFQVVAWTDLFTTLVGNGAESKLERVLPNAIKKIEVKNTGLVKK